VTTTNGRGGDRAHFAYGFVHRKEAPMGNTERLPDEIWDALTEHFGDVRTKDERGRRNAAVKQLREAGATPEEIRVTFEFCEARFTSFTEMALCSWLSRALHEASKQDKRGDFLRLLRREEQ
jgi:hypothetical protein